MKLKEGYEGIVVAMIMLAVALSLVGLARWRLCRVRIGAVRHRWPLVLAILIYVTLDLSLPGMPGAFVFAPDDSVESVQGARARAAADVVAMPAEPSGVAGLSHPPAEHVRRLVRANRVEPRGRPVSARPFPAHVDPAPASEDPH